MKVRTRFSWVDVLGVLLLLCGGAFAPTPGSAQVSGATLSGTVSDVSGAAVRGAQIEIRNVNTGAVRSVKSNADGFYSAPNLLPGSYEVKVEATGFSSLLQRSITLTVGAEQTFNPALAIGQLNQTVVVTTAPPSVQLSSSAVGATVDGTTVRELPLNGRDYTSLAALEPGVISIPNQATTGFSANKGNRGFGNQLSDGGHRPMKIPIGSTASSSTTTPTPLPEAPPASISAWTPSTSSPCSPAPTPPSTAAPRAR